MKKNRGFTLVEIVIVIAIIGLLMVVLVPSITSAWKTNNMKAARLQAERVAKSIKVGILAGDIKTSSDKAEYGGYAKTNKINPTLNPISYIGGINSLYDLPESNEDLMDITSEDEAIMKIAYDSDNKKIVIFKAGADVKKSIDENVDYQLYYEN